MISSSLPLFFLAAAVSASVIGERSTESNEIRWGPCGPGFGTDSRFCGTLTVPLDYTNSSCKDTLTLELLKVPALQQPSKGSVLLNFGGPGGDGKHNLDGAASTVQQKVGLSYDLIAFDPRGTGNTLNFSCYANATEKQLATLSTHLLTSNASNVAPGRLWAQSANYASNCAANAKNNDMLGTAFVARDLMHVVDALGGDRRLRYWGISYGTALGQTVAAMFPDRIERMVLDGVLNPHEYFKGYDYGQFASTDQTFSGILSECVKAGPAACPLAKPNVTAEQLEASVLATIEDIKFNPIPVGISIIDYAVVKSFISGLLYYSSQYDILVTTLDALLTGNLTALTTFDASTAPNPSAALGDSLPRIKCGDKIPRTALLKDFEPVIAQFSKTGKIFGELGSVAQINCAQWNSAARERYEGDFNVQTRNPILFVGNTFDPATSFAAARNASETFRGSVLLQQDGFGHTTLSQNSTCTDQATKAYFENGTLPAPGTKCKVDAPLFGKK